MVAFYCFDDDSEQLMIANDPSTSGVLVDATCRALPNLAARLGRALYKSDHIKYLEIHFDCFGNEERESSLSAVLQWIGTSATLSTLRLRSTSPTPRSLSLLEWCLDILCDNRPLLSLPPLECIVINYGIMSAITFGCLLQFCQPTAFSFFGTIHQGSVTNRNDAMENIRNAVSTNTSLQELSLAVNQNDATFSCAVIEALPRQVKLARLALFAQKVGGRSVVPQLVLDTFIPRLKKRLITLKQIEFINFCWTESTVSVLDQLLPNVSAVAFDHCSFDEAACFKLLSIFGSQAEDAIGRPSKLCMFDRIEFPDSFPVLERLTGSTPGLQLQVLYFNSEIQPRDLKGTLAGLVLPSSCLQALELWSLKTPQCGPLFHAIPAFTKLSSLSFAVAADFTPFVSALLLSAKRNGSIKRYNVYWPIKKQKDADQLEHYAARNTQLPDALAATTTTTTTTPITPTSGGVEVQHHTSELAILPSLLRCSVDLKVPGRSYVLRSLLRCGRRVGLNKES